MIFFLSHFLGFLIQYGTAMVICLIPYHEEAFLLSRKRTIQGFLMMAVPLSALDPVILKITERIDVNQLNAAANGYMLCAILLSCVLYFHFIRAEMIKKWLVLMLAMIYAVTHYLIANALYYHLEDTWTYEVYPPLATAMYALTAVFLFPLMAMIMRRTIRKYLDEMEIGQIRRGFIIILIVSILYLLLLISWASLPEYLEMENWRNIAHKIMRPLAVLILVYCLLFREGLWRKRDSDQKKYAEIQSLQYAAITREMEDFRRTRHDMRHYLGQLSELLAQGKTEEMKKYLDELIGYTVSPAQVNYCKNEVINGLLQYYAGYASEDNIRFEIHARCENLAIQATDLTVVLGNILENAIRSSRQTTEAQRRLIQVRIDTIGTFLVLEVVNPCAGVRLSEAYASFRKTRSEDGFWPAEAYLSSREDGGLGLGSIAHTASKYDGSARFRYDETEQTFTTRVRLDVSGGK